MRYSRYPRDSEHFTSGLCKIMSNSTTVIDPVCGMTVDPATAPAHTEYQGTTYYFCCSHCLTKFQADPQKYLTGKPEPMSLGLPLPSPSGRGVGSKGIPPTVGKRQYICPMDPEVVSDQPGSCPKCGMAWNRRTLPPRRKPIRNRRR